MKFYLYYFLPACVHQSKCYAIWFVNNSFICVFKYYVGNTR